MNCAMCLFKKEKFGKMTMDKFSLGRLTKTGVNLCLIDLWKNVFSQCYTSNS